MLIDLIFSGLAIIAIFKGLRRGLIVAIFSVLAFVMGLAAALKFSVEVSGYLGNNMGISAKWLPFISFLFVFIVVVLLVRIASKLLESATNAIMLGPLNKLGGVILYLLIYTFIYSIFLFYAVYLGLLKNNQVATSSIYPIISPWGPWVTEKIGHFIPVFKDMFTQLTLFFQKTSNP